MGLSRYTILMMKTVVDDSSSEPEPPLELSNDEESESPESGPEEEKVDQ